MARRALTRFIKLVIRHVPYQAWTNYTGMIGIFATYRQQLGGANRREKTQRESDVKCRTEKAAEQRHGTIDTVDAIAIHRAYVLTKHECEDTRENNAGRLDSPA